VSAFLLAGTFASGVTVVRAGEATSATGRIGLVEQTVSITEGDVVRLVVRPLGTLPAEANVVVRVHDRILDRAGLVRARSGARGPSVDRVTLPLGELPRTDEGFVVVEVPTTVGAPAVGLLRIAEPGLHVLTVRIERPGEPDAPFGELLTFVQLAPPDGGNLEVAWVARLRSHPTVQPDGGTTIDPAVRAELTALVELLETIDAPLSFVVTPELLAGLGRSTQDDRELLERLGRALGEREVIADTFVSIDPSAAARADLVDEYTSQLRAGEDALAAALPRAISRRTVHVVDTEIDSTGAAMLRDLGIRALVVPPNARTSITDDAAVDPTQVAQVDLGFDATLTATFVDPELARRFADDEPTTVTGERNLTVDTYDTIFDLLAIRTEVLDRLGALDDPSRSAQALAGRSVTLTAPDGHLGRTDLVARVLALIDETVGLDAATMSTVTGLTDVAISDGLPVRVGLRDTVGDDLTALAGRIFALGIDTATIGSVLPPGDARPSGWAETIRVMPATELTDEELDAFEASVRDDLDDIRDAVTVPSVSDVTLGGRRSSVRIKVRNTADVPLTVTVRLESPKLAFPEGQALVTAPPADVIEVEIPVEARTNGRFPVSVSLLTPLGDVPLHPPVEFAARVNALTGLGQVVTAVGALLLASWWIHHLRSTRRRRRAGVEGVPPSTADA
jgi:hypothetical protein